MDLIKYIPGEPIRADGLYSDIPINDYHGKVDLCDGPSVSNSGLRRLYECPEKFWAASPMNPKREPVKETEAQLFGRMAHSLCVEGRLPADIIISKYDEFRTNEAKAWKAEQEAAGRTVFKAAAIEHAYGMADRLAKEPMIRDGLFAGPTEVSAIARDPATGIWVKARPDCIPTDTIWADYKTAASADPRDIERSIMDYGYHCQAALSAEVIARVTGRVMESFVLVVQEKLPPYTVTIAAIDDDSVTWGARLNRVALDRLAQCLKADDWPGYSEGPVTVGLPAYERKRLKDHDAIIPEVPSLKEIAHAD